MRAGSVVIDGGHFQFALYGSEDIPTLHVFLGFFDDYSLHARIDLRTLAIGMVDPPERKKRYLSQFHTGITKALEKPSKVFDGKTKVDELRILWKRINRKTIQRTTVEKSARKASILSLISEEVAAGFQ